MSCAKIRKEERNQESSPNRRMDRKLCKRVTSIKLRLINSRRLINQSAGSPTSRKSRHFVPISGSRRSILCSRTVCATLQLFSPPLFLQPTLKHVSISFYTVQKVRATKVQLQRTDRASFARIRPLHVGDPARLIRRSES